MARPLRIELPGGLYHVMSRVDQRRAIVRHDAHRHRRLDWLERTAETCRWRLHALALLTHRHTRCRRTARRWMRRWMHRRYARSPLRPTLQAPLFTNWTELDWKGT